MTNERFDITFDPTYIAGLSDKELVDKINKLAFYDGDLMRDLCYRADLLDEYCEADDTGEAIEICIKAAEILGFEID